MMDGDQSQTDVSGLRANLVSPKETIHIGCWNVRTLYQSGKLEQTAEEMHKYQLKMLALQETRWTGSGKRYLATGDTIIWSGRSDNNHLQGVALMLDKEDSRAPLEWNPVNERLLYVRLKTKFTKLSITVVYAPTEDAEDAEEESKEEFYCSLQATVEKIPKHDMLIIMGDLNARVGSVNYNHESTLGKHGVGTMNDNGERLCDFCETNGLRVGGTLFPHKEIHKLTWKSPDGKTETQIDHVIINNKQKRSLNDVQVKRLADVGSDHHLLVAKVKLKLRKVRTGKSRGRRFDCSKLQKLEVQRKFALKLANRFNALNNEAEMAIDEFNCVLRETSKEIHGYQKKRREEWISETTWTKIARRRAETKERILSTTSQRLKERFAAQYAEKDKEVKRSCWKDKRQYFKKLASKVEEAAKNNDIRTLYKTTKSMKGSHGDYHDILQRTVKLSKTKGKELTDGENILKQS